MGGRGVIWLVEQSQSCMLHLWKERLVLMFFICVVTSWKINVPLFKGVMMGVWWGLAWPL